ncbi:winged helix-turn-helix transcriptional regulator [Candidatus Dojkabacteria bacterium]|nr:winged helix-turn-helix transcriptional regulator [Candidatus Dojkabacteria bacterium]
MSGHNEKNFVRFKKGYKKDLLKAILAQIKQGESFTLMGMPGIGKTDLFQTFDKNIEFWQELFPKEKIDFIVVFLDLTKLLDISPLGFYRLLLTRIQKTVAANIKDEKIQSQIKEIHDNAVNGQDLFVIFSAIEDIIKTITQEANFNLCILIDDFGTLADFDKQFFNSLKALRNINKWQVTLAFSSDRDLLTSLTPEILDELYDLFLNKQFWLKPISKEDAFLGLEEWERERGIKFTSKIKQSIFEISGGHPGYMRALSRIYFDSGKDASILDKKDIRKLASHSTTLARSEKFWTKLLDEYKDFLIEFVQNPNTPINHRAKYLENTGVIKEENGEKKLFSPLLEIYLKSKTGKKSTVEIPVTKGLYIDPKTKTVYVDAKPLKREPTTNEYKILQLLYKNKGKIVTREALAEILWGQNSIEKYSDWAIDRTLSRIRKKLGDKASTPRFIETIKGRGLRLIS